MVIFLDVLIHLTQLLFVQVCTKMAEYISKRNGLI